MSQGNNVLTKPRASLWVVVGAVVFWAVSITYLYRSEYGGIIARLNQKMDFGLRDYLGKSTTLDPRIKVFGFDDKTMSWLDSGDLTEEQWAKFMLALDKRQPKAIFIDKIFTVSNGRSSTRQTKNLKKLVARMKTPVVVGAYTYPYAIRERETYPLAKAGRKVEGLTGRKNLYKDYSDYNGPIVYGPGNSAREMFNRVGHIFYDGSGKVAPLLEVKDGLFIPHLAFAGLVNSTFTLKSGSLFFGNQRIPVDYQGDVHIDWLNRKEFFSRTIAARNDLSRSFKGKPLDAVKQNDIVVIIPSFFTGNTDHKETPYGMLPGGAHVVSLLNSILTNKWIKPVAYVEVLLLIFVLVGGLVAARLSPLRFALFVLVNLIVIAAAGVYLFSFHSITTSWLFVVIAFIGSSVSSFVGRSRDAERKSHIIRSALDGVVNAEKVERIIKNPDELNFEARERVVTVMFIDVVGFSLIAENQIPRRAFDALKSTLSAIAKVVYDHGGVVNKNLGDGLLCFFGYDIESDLVVPDHAEKAMVAAIRIQEQNLLHTLSVAAKGGMVFPLRIGLHTTSVFMGDLGTGKRIDFTVIGNGVNFAKRLEGACRPNSILISHTTLELITNLMLTKEAFSEKQIKIKHHTDLVSAHEYDPIYAQPEMRDRASQAFRTCVNAARSEQRWTLSNPELITVRSNYGVGELINFSASGLSLKLGRGLARGEQIVLTIGSKHGDLEESLMRENLRQILCEVAWSYAEKNGHVHGLRFSGIALEKSETLVKLIREHGIHRGGSIIGTGPVSRIGEAI